ncbi:MAG: hypothetical protein GX614_04340 [Sandaracinaceae bacterium]|nr:hypothetical protein [Sandaracinaceae bacterium]
MDESPTTTLSDASENWLKILRWACERTGKAEPTQDEIDEAYKLWEAGERPRMPTSEEMDAEVERELKETLERLGLA